MMQKVKFLTFLLALVASVGAISSCGSDDDDSSASGNLAANANGVYFSYYDGQTVETETVYLWINDYAARYWSSGSDLALSSWLDRNKTYREFNSMEIVYDVLSDDFNTEVNESTDFSSFNPNPSGLVKKLKSLKSQYRYILVSSGDFILFNRTSEKNY